MPIRIPVIIECRDCDEKDMTTIEASERREASSDPKCPFTNSTGQMALEFDDVRLPEGWGRAPHYEFLCPKHT